ncbi:MAG: hypothetical protein ACK4WJ_05450 [Endomicrobiia bacterium]
MNNNKDIYCEIVFAVPLRQSFTYKFDLSSYAIKNLCDLIGMRVLVDFGEQKDKVGVIIDVKKKVENLTFEIKSVKTLLDKSPLFNKEQVKTAKELSRLYFVSVGEFLNQFFPIEGKYEITQGLVCESEKQNFNSYFELDKEFVNIIKKRKKILFMPKDVKEKFEFYKNLVFYSLKENLQTIILFSSNYYLNDFYNYLMSLQIDNKILNKKIAVYSGEKSLNERYKIWYFVRNKLLNVVLCSKIGAFLPLDNVSYILIDEPDFKGFINDSAPMYNVYDIVNYRFKTKNIIYTSFVPSVKLMYENKRFVVKRNRELTHKIYFVKKKVAEIIKKEFYKFKKVIIFFPYKGYSRYYICSRCGTIFYGYKMEKQNKKFLCDKCKSNKFVNYGVGIEKFVETIKKFLPATINIAYFDSNFKENKINGIIDEFNNNKIDVIVSTYEIFNYIYRINFSNVGSVYFAYLDALLNKINYLNYENVYNMIELFKVSLTNNFCTNIYLEIFNKISDTERLLYPYEKFYKTELNLRKELMYPPFCKTLKIGIVYTLSLKQVIENLVEELKSIQKTECYELDFNKKVRKGEKFITTLFIKIVNDEKRVTNRIVEVLNKNIKNNLDIMVYIQFDPKD